jgi:hypothetical protein
MLHMQCCNISQVIHYTETKGPLCYHVLRNKFHVIRQKVAKILFVPLYQVQWIGM